MRAHAACFALLALCPMLAIAPGAFAQAEPGDLGIFADPAGTRTVASIEPSVPLRVYVVAFPPPEGIRAFELAVRSPQVIAVSWRLRPDFVSTTPLGENAWLFSLRQCALPSAAAVLVELDLLALSGVVDAPVCLSRIEGSSLNSMANGEPAYARCSAPGVGIFGVAQNGNGIYPNGCLILNATQRAPVGVERLDLGMLKARWSDIMP